MMDFKVGMQLKHEKHGEVKILNADGFYLVQVETLDGDIFYTTRASFGPVKKKKASKPRAKKSKRVQKVDDPVDLVDELKTLTAREELLDVDVYAPEETEGENEETEIEEAAD
jgi:hypothetical protein